LPSRGFYPACLGGTSEKGEKVPGEKLSALTRFQTAPSLNKFGRLAKEKFCPRTTQPSHTTARQARMDAKESNKGFASIRVNWRDSAGRPG
jgi:hypothetical protein